MLIMFYICRYFNACGYDNESREFDQCFPSTYGYAIFHGDLTMTEIQIKLEFIVLQTCDSLKTKGNLVFGSKTIKFLCIILILGCFYVDMCRHCSNILENYLKFKEMCL